MRGMPTLTALLSVCLMICCSGLTRADQIPWQTDIEAALREASQSGQPVLMQFTACGAPTANAWKKERGLTPRWLSESVLIL